MNEVYNRLREFLDRLPGGYPATESGVELKILERLFTPDEAELVLKLSMLPETVGGIASRTGLPIEGLAEKLEDLAKKGSIYRARIKGEVRYMAVQFAVGIYEFHLNLIDRELSGLMEEYLPHLGKVWESTRTKQLRVVPAVSIVDALPRVDTYDKVREMVKSQKTIAVAQCICRKEQGLLDNPCPRPQETCLVFDNGAEYYLENGMGRKITADEAIAILDEAEKAALVLSPSNTQYLSNICCCCGCCCGILRNLKSLPDPANHVHSNYLAKIDSELCSSCGACAERCQMDAIAEDERAYAVNQARCIGCGLCVPTCPEEAIAMEHKPETHLPPKNLPHMGIQIMKDRGLLK